MRNPLTPDAKTLMIRIILLLELKPFQQNSCILIFFFLNLISIFFFLQTNDFWREAQILSKLHHPNVVAFYGVVPDGTGGTLATVTEFMVNGSLRNVLLRKDRWVVYVSVRHFPLCTMMWLFTRSEQNAWPSEETYHCYGCGIWDGILALQKHSAFWFEMQ